MKALIELDVPEWQIGQEVTIHFPDSMCKKGVCKAAISYDRVTREVVGTKDDVKALYGVMLEDYMNAKNTTNDICKVGTPEIT